MSLDVGTSTSGPKTSKFSLIWLIALGSSAFTGTEARALKQDVDPMNALGKDSFCYYVKPRRLCVGFDAVEEEPAKEINPSRSFFRKTPIMSNPLEDKNVMEKKIDIPQAVETQVRILRNQAEQTNIPALTSQPYKWTIDDAHKIMQRTRIQGIVLDQVNQDIEEIQRKQSEYIEALSKAKRDNLEALSGQTVENPKLWKILQKVPMVDNTHQLVKSRLTNMLKLQSKRQSFWEYLKDAFHWLFGTNWGKQVEARWLAIQLRSQNSVQKIRLINSKYESAVEELYMNAIWRGEFFKEEWTLLQQLYTKPHWISIEQEKLVNELHSAFLVRSLPSEAFAEATEEWLEGIQKFELNKDDELHLFILKGIQDVGLTPDQVVLMKQLEKRNDVTQKLHGFIGMLEKISQKMSSEADFTQEEHKFLETHFKEELELMDKEIANPDRMPLHSHMAYTVFPHIPRGRTHTSKFYEREQSQVGIYLSKCLDTSEQLLLLHVSQTQTIITPQRLARQFFLHDAEEFSRVLQKSPTTMHLIEEIAPQMIDSSNYNGKETQTLKVFRDKLRARKFEKVELGKAEKEVGNSIIKEEHKRLQSLSDTEKGIAMLKLMVKCDVLNPPSITNSILEKLNSNLKLDKNEVVVMKEMTNLYQMAIINTMSENDVVLSHLLYLKAQGTDLKQHVLPQRDGVPRVNAEKLRLQLGFIADSPLEKYILYKAVERYIPYTLESIILSELEEIEATSNTLSGVQKQIYSLLQQPLWERRPLTNTQKKVMLELYLDRLSSKSRSESVENMLEHVLQTESIGSKFFKEYLKEEEWEKFHMLHHQTFKISKQSIEYLHLKVKIADLLVMAEKREKLMNKMNHARYQLEFNHLQIQERLKFLENMKETYLKESQDLEGELAAVWQWYSSAHKEIVHHKAHPHKNCVRKHFIQTRYQQETQI
ncbi:hypothetical protein CROQUDRAFT_692498 [Cronartium quercuum f. sp. fusiforme G11]|uniref:Uncharacterized protein n=1 Tax=Cronartium quercuum f. sp. fusiforme G11 TaxID=708437 RepID=A0A9P6NNA2_9BASI|nr:hypothetical protein CROQUDRAFT_692498 [Cronartium quercuum f. sp. fusiforme G11]